MRYISYKMNDANNAIVIDKEAGSSATYSEFLKDLPDNDCRYAVFDFEFTADDGGQRNKIVFISWF
jgi:cofilin